MSGRRRRGRTGSARSKDWGGARAARGWFESATGSSRPAGTPAWSRRTSRCPRTLPARRCRRWLCRSQPDDHHDHHDHHQHRHNDHEDEEDRRSRSEKRAPSTDTGRGCREKRTSLPHFRKDGEFPPPPRQPPPPPPRWPNQFWRGGLSLRSRFSPPLLSGSAARLSVAPWPRRTDVSRGSPYLPVSPRTRTGIPRTGTSGRCGDRPAALVPASGTSSSSSTLSSSRGCLPRDVSSPLVLDWRWLPLLLLGLL